MIDRSPSYHRFWLMNYLRTFCRFGLCMSSLHLKKTYIYIDEHIAVVWIHGIPVYFSKIQYLKSLKPCNSEQHVWMMTSKKKKETHTHTCTHIWGYVQHWFRCCCPILVQKLAPPWEVLDLDWLWEISATKIWMPRSGRFSDGKPPGVLLDDAVRRSNRWCWAKRCF